jgi:hypothetical protein
VNRDIFTFTFTFNFKRQDSNKRVEKSINHYIGTNGLKGKILKFTEYIYTITIYLIFVGRVSVISIATPYGLDGPGSKPVGARFSAPVQTGPGAYPASYTMGTGSLSQK